MTFGDRARRRRRRRGARVRLAGERRRIETGPRRRDEQAVEPRSAERAASGPGAWQRDDAIDTAAGRVAHDPPAAPFGVSEASVGVHGRSVGKAWAIDPDEGPLARQVSAVGVVIVAADFASPACRRNTCGVRRAKRRSSSRRARRTRARAATNRRQSSRYGQLAGLFAPRPSCRDRAAPRRSSLPSLSRVVGRSCLRSARSLSRSGAPQYGREAFWKFDVAHRPPAVYGAS